MLHDKINYQSIFNVTSFKKKCICFIKERKKELYLFEVIHKKFKGTGIQR